MRHYGVTEREIWNMDETGFMVGMLKECKVLVPRKIKQCYTRDPSNKEMVTCVEAVSAAGEYIPTSSLLNRSHSRYNGVKMLILMANSMMNWPIQRNWPVRW